MDNLIPKETLLYLFVGLASYGLNLIITDFWKGLLVCVIATGIFIIRVVLKKKGYDVGKK